MTDDALLTAPTSTSDFEQLCKQYHQLERDAQRDEARSDAAIAKAKEKARLANEPRRARQQAIEALLGAFLKQHRSLFIEGEFGIAEFRNASVNYHQDAVGTLEFTDEKALIAALERSQSLRELVETKKSVKKNPFKEMVRKTPGKLKRVAKLFRIVHGHSIIITLKPTPAEKRRNAKPCTINIPLD